ncbi:MAG: 2-oxoacid:acceptor oxidoreductase subunit alpha [Candidatus Dormibacteraeota bacterium]|nr:2-oxoacid:acceptor oxidoreductase subunit alpha [Candidatus Dormibacteraeota bacterium]
MVLERLAPETAHRGKVRVVDTAIKLANVNGTGSSSANNLLMQAFFRMGIPVSGKNLFPSNIQGLPTWYEIRVNGSGHTGRVQEFDVMVAMNTQTHAQDIREVRAGGYVVWDSSWPLDTAALRSDVSYLGVPVAQLCNEAFRGPRARMLMQNIVTCGVVVALMAIELDIVSRLLDEKFAGKARLRESNQRALMLGYDYAREHFACPLPCHVHVMDGTADSILIDGNTAAALGFLYAGATVAAWYPITPSTSLMDAFTQLCKRYRRDPATGRNNYLILQAEDELASIGIVIGASWNGARAFTSTSGPGISLMNELIGLAYYTETPAVIVDVQRAGPSTGMPTRTQQGDLLACAYASHGDTKHILLLPGDPAECFDFAARSFDLAERFQTPVMMLSDVDIAMNDWVIPRLRWDDARVPDRGRVLAADELESRIDAYHRYASPDSEHVAARTLPGVDAKGAYFARGSGHDALGGYTETPEAYLEVVDRLASKHAAAAGHVPEPLIESNGSRVAIVTMGGCGPAVREAIEVLDEQGLPLDYMRIRAFPFSQAVEAFLDEHDTVFVVEQNRDAQLRSLLVLETTVPKHRLRSVLAYGGMPLSAGEVVDGVRAQMET